jgi:glucose-6-phosphate-specific signal transduction histidine kinase
MLAALYALAWLLGYECSSMFWFLPAGLRFAVLWLTPPRHWAWWAAGDVTAILVLNAAGDDFRTWTGFALATFAPWIGCAIAVLISRRGAVFAAPESPQRMAATLGAMFAAALVNAPLLSGMRAIEGGTAEFTWSELFLGHLGGDFVGMLMVAPIAFQLARRGQARSERLRMWRDLLLLFVPVMVGLIALMLWPDVASPYAVMLALAPALLMAFGHGWRGAAWALSATSVGFHVVGLHAELPIPGFAMQLFLAVVGAGALLLGSAIGSLRRLNAALIERNRRDKAVTLRLATQADELRELSRRLVRAREDEQGRLAHELHDELGQSVAAMGTQLSLMARRYDAPGLPDALQTQRELVLRVQTTIRDVLNGLRPAALDHFGLETALREGPLQQLLANAGVAYRLDLTGPAGQLGADARSAVYRICQEAATNCVRHAQATSFQVQLNVDRTLGGDLEVHLRAEDDGRGFGAATAVEGHGLRGIRDRVMALAGEFRCSSTERGTRLTVWFLDRAAVQRGQ